MPNAMALMFRGIFRKDVAATNLIRRPLALSLGVASLFVSAVPTTGASSLCRPAWSEMPTPSGSNSFYGAAAITTTDVWAVGSHYDGINDRPLAEHFDGAQWVTVPVPAPGSGTAYLRGVAGSSGADVWAVGYQITRSGANKR